MPTFTFSVNTQVDQTNKILCLLIGYHPWFCHLLTLQSPDTPPPSKWEHYASILLPSPSSSSYSDQEVELQRIIGDFPDPIPLKPLLERMKSHIKQAQNDGRLVMVGEVGLDKAFRIPYPVQSSSSPFVTDDEVEQEGGNERVGAADGDEPEKDVARAGRAERTEGEGIQTDIDEGATKRNTLTPFRPSMEHQLAVLDKQFEIALEMGVNVSVHSVKCQGGLCAPSYAASAWSYLSRDFHGRHSTNNFGC